LVRKDTGLHKSVSQARESYLQIRNALGRTPVEMISRGLQAPLGEFLYEPKSSRAVSARNMLKMDQAAAAWLDENAYSEPEKRPKGVEVEVAHGMGCRDH
jgi:hypothetical protein